MIAETTWSIEDFRKRIREMPDEKLIRYGKAARYMADPRNAADIAEGIRTNTMRAKTANRTRSNQATRPSETFEPSIELLGNNRRGRQANKAWQLDAKP